MAIQIDITERKHSEAQLLAKQKELELLNFQLSRQKLAAESALKAEARISLSLEQEIKKSKELQERLKVLANHDEMTGIPNRRYFVKRAESEITRANRYNSSLSLCSFDIDHFKQVNDRFGHQVGDDVIRQVVNIAQRMLRKDIDIIGRLGGEEFCILLPQTDIKGCREVMERIRNTIATTSMIKDYPITCSFGIAQLTHQDNFGSLIARSDQTLYQAKSQGRDRVIG